VLLSVVSEAGMMVMYNFCRGEGAETIRAPSAGGIGVMDIAQLSLVLLSPLIMNGWANAGAEDGCGCGHVSQQQIDLLTNVTHLTPKKKKKKKKKMLELFF